MKPPLLLIHGYPFDHTLWDFVVKELKDDAKIFAPDLPGFGTTPLLQSGPSIDVFADELLDLLNRNDIDRIVIAGMSMGGYIALSFAERYSERLAGLALIATQASADTDEMRQGRRQMIEKVRATGPRTAAEAALGKVFAERNKSKPALQKFVFDGAEKAGTEGITWALEAMARRPDRIAFLSKIDVPVVVLHGVEDKFIPVERAREMARKIPKAEFIEVTEAGHGLPVLPVEAPREVASALRDLLKDAEHFISHNPREHAHADQNRPGIVWSPTEAGL
jgi:3-oxoadipate enol-lactonase